MQDIKIVNYVNVAGEVIPWDELPAEKRQKIAEVIQETMMSSAGYRRKSA